MIEHVFDAVGTFNIDYRWLIRVAPVGLSCSSSRKAQIDPVGKQVDELLDDSRRDASHDESERATLHHSDDTSSARYSFGQQSIVSSSTHIRSESDR
jgi:hypothetical protein